MMLSQLTNNWSETRAEEASPLSPVLRQPCDIILCTEIVSASLTGDVQRLQIALGELILRVDGHNRWADVGCRQKRKDKLEQARRQDQFRHHA